MPRYSSPFRPSGGRIGGKLPNIIRFLDSIAVVVDKDETGVRSRHERYNSMAIFVHLRDCGSNP